MRKLFASLTCLAALGLLLAPLNAAQADYEYDGFNYEPVAVLSVASVDEVVDDMKWLAQSAGFPDQAGFLATMADIYTGGWDAGSPVGVVIGTNGDDFVPLGFVPVENLEKVFQALKQNTGRMPEDEGDGLYVYQGPNGEIFIREQGGYAFFGRDPEVLDTLPEDPEDILGGLVEEYTLGVELYVQAVPAEQRDFAIQQIRIGMESGLRQQPGETDEAYELRQQVVDNQLEQIEQLVHDADTITIGLAVNEDDGNSYLDFAVTVLEDSKLARQIQAMEDVSTEYGGFLLPGAAVTLNFSSQMLSEDVDRTLVMLEHAQNNALAELERSNDFDNDAQRSAATDLMQGLFEVIKDTVQEGRVDGGAALVLEDGSMTMVAGGHVADGSDLEEQFDKIIELAENEDDFPGVEHDVLDYEGVTFHQMLVPMDDRQAQKVFGDELEILVGFGDDSFYVVVGSDCEDTVRAVIDGSSDSPSDLPPVQFNMALAPILRFAADMEDNPAVEMAADALEDRGSGDRIMLHANVIENGVKYRLVLEPGVIEAIGTAAQAAAAGIGQQPAF